MLAPTLFITGMQRSGTTLVEKLLSSHPEISILSQPFPFLYLDVMRAFFHRRGLSSPAYPLGTLFGQSDYRPEDLAAFLSEHVVTAETVAAAFVAMEGFSGQYTRFSAERLQGALEALEPGDLASVVSQLWHRLAHAPEAPWCGGKETSCEELAPHLLSRGVHVLLLLRDPRDVLASLNHGRGELYAGRPKPTLYNVRQWRKSVAFALHLESDLRFLALRYEDLVSAPAAALDRVASWLGCSPFDDSRALEQDGGELVDQHGRPWASNSSHSSYRSVSSRSVGRYREVLRCEVTELVETLCRPELDRLGYPRDSRVADPERLLSTFREPYPMSRPELAKDLPSARNTADELERLAVLYDPDAAPRPDLLLFDDLPARLREDSRPL